MAFKHSGAWKITAQSTRTIGGRTGAAEVLIRADTQTPELDTVAVARNHRFPALEQSFESLVGSHRKVLRLDHEDARSPGEGTVSATDSWTGNPLFSR